MDPRKNRDRKANRFHNASGKGPLRSGRAAGGDRGVNDGALFGGQLPTHRAGGLFDLAWPLGATERRCDTWLTDRPIDDELGNRVPGRSGDISQLVDEVQVLS